MASPSNPCIKISDNSFVCSVCPSCSSKCIVKNGFAASRKQQYLCKHCGKRFISRYSYNAYQPHINGQIILLLKEGLGIRSIARVLTISVTTVLKRIRVLADKLIPPPLVLGRQYEVDELRTFVKCKNKLIWVVCALDKTSKQVVRYAVGPRTNKTLNKVLKSLVAARPHTIFTDALRNYRYLLDSSIHQVTRYSTNHVERHNLTLRTHLKRLNRRTLCFSKKATYLDAVIRIYLWA